MYTSARLRVASTQRRCGPEQRLAAESGRRTFDYEEIAACSSYPLNHFGHVHYRRNRYNAALHLLAVEGTWKIREIEVFDERRVL